MKPLLLEFKDFLMRGSLIELAVAFVMGLAFAAVINSLVDNLVMPVIAAVIGKPDFSALTFTINDSVFRYGAFITDVIQFVAIAAAVFFFIVKPVQLARAQRGEQLLVPALLVGPARLDRRPRQGRAPGDRADDLRPWNRRVPRPGVRLQLPALAHGTREHAA